MGHQDEVGARGGFLEGLQQEVGAVLIEAVGLLHQDPAMAAHGGRQGGPLDDAPAEARLVVGIEALADLVDADDARLALGDDAQQVGQFEGQVVAHHHAAALALAAGVAAEAELAPGQLQGHPALADALGPREEQRAADPPRLEAGQQALADGVMASQIRGEHQSTTNPALRRSGATRAQMAASTWSTGSRAGTRATRAGWVCAMTRKRFRTFRWNSRAA